MQHLTKMKHVVNNDGLEDIGDKLRLLFKECEPVFAWLDANIVRPFYVAIDADLSRFAATVSPEDAGV